MNDEPEDPSKPIPLDRDKRLIEKIEKLMASPPDNGVKLDITPGVARHVLAHWRGHHNRHEKPAAIENYAADMSKPDGWMLNGSTIVFTDRHLLGDGQNRMIACVRANKPFTTFAVFGVPHEYFFSIDQGRVRGPADVLTIHGVPNANIVYPAVRWAELLANTKTIKRRRTFTPPQILELYKTKHKGVEDFLKEARRVVSSNRKQPLSMVMAMLYTFNKIDSDLAAEFSEHWATCAYPGSFRAIQIMQQELGILGGKVTRIHDVVRAAMIVNAWNVVREGTKPRAALIRWDMAMAFPEIK